MRRCVIHVAIVVDIVVLTFVVLRYMAFRDHTRLKTPDTKPLNTDERQLHSNPTLPSDVTNDVIPDHVTDDLQFAFDRRALRTTAGTTPLSSATGPWLVTRGPSERREPLARWRGEHVRRQCGANRYALRQYVTMAIRTPHVPIPLRPLHHVETARCHHYNVSVRINHTVYADVFDSTVLRTDDVTLVSQATVNKQSYIIKLLELWPGPMSLTIYVPPDADEELMNLICHTSVIQRDNLGVHLVPAQGRYYPTNHLRNIAVQAVRTDFMFLNDIDFLVNHKFYDALRNYTEILKDQALVIPAFESVQTREVPNDKKQMIDLWKNENEVYPFHEEIYSRAHEGTMYDRWEMATEPYNVVYTAEYEPYLLLRVAEAPLFSQEFVGRGYNKAQYTLELHTLGFLFVVLPDVFVLHMPHGKSNPKGGTCVSQRYKRYKEAMLERRKLLRKTAKEKKKERHREA